MSMDPAIRKRATRFILLTVLIYSMGFGIIMPVLPDLIRHLTGVDAAEAARMGAWIGATYGLFQVLMMPTVGNLGDRFGRRPVFLVSLFAFGLDFLLMGLAPSIAWLFVGRAIAGGLGAVFGPANAAMADMSSAEDRAASFGKVGAAFGLGFVLGPVIGGFLGDFGPRVPFYVAGALAFANGIYGWLVFPETMPEDKRRPFEWKRANPLGAFASLGRIKGILPVALIYFLWATAGNVYPASWSFFAPIQYGWDSRMVGLSLGLVGISMAIFQAVIIRRFITRFGERKTAYIGMVCGIASYLVVAFVPNGTIILILLFANGFSGLAMPSLNAMMSMRAPASQQGELQGLVGSLAALSLMIAQFTYNYALAAFTDDGAPVRFPGAPYVIAACVGATALLALFFLRKRDERELCSMAELVALKSVASERVEALLDTAFGHDRHNRTAYLLRIGSKAIAPLSFALLDGEALIGTIQCWPVKVGDTTLALVGPVAVSPDRQGQGHGHRLMHATLGAAPDIGDPPMVMIGDPEYYGRFGFTADASAGWTLPGPWEPRRLLVRNAGNHPLPKTGMVERAVAL